MIKPAELTPLTTLRLGELALEAGIPEGVLNVVVGKGSVVGQRLVEHPDVAKIGFTGSTEVGQRVMQGAAATIKRVTLELGGKSANVDLRRRRSREGGRVGAVLGVRQRRPGLLRPVADPRRGVGVRPLPRAARRVDPRRQGRRSDRRRHRDGAADLGRAPRDRRARSSRASRCFAATFPTGPGFWFPCTLVEASNDDRVAREEVFGPVAAVIPFTDEADAIRIANDTPYGLSGSIWTRDGARALRVARGVSAGVLSVNSNSSVRVHTPFGGMKQSGFGRELGMAALDGYTDLKNVFISTEG